MATKKKEVTQNAPLFKVIKDTVVRSGAGHGAAIIKELNKGDEVNIINKIDDGNGGSWYQITEGYIEAKEVRA